MRMKKYLILAVTAAIVAVGCTKTFEVTPTPETPIGFGTWANTLTKTSHATGAGNTAFTDGETFDVFGKKTLSSGDVVVFEDDDVQYASSTQTWSYTNTRFWDPNASSYTFYAVLPKDKLNLTHTNNTGDNRYAKTGLFVSQDISFDDPTSYTNDILVANQTVVNGTGSAVPYTYTSANPVEMSFNHVASCVDMMVKKDNTLANATVTVTGLSLLNIHNSGHFTVGSYSTNVPNVTWADASTVAYLDSDNTDDATHPNTYVVSLSGSGVAASAYTTTYGANNARTTTGTDDYDNAGVLFSDYVFMPQTLTANGQKVALTYTIQVGSETANSYSAEFDMRDFFETDAKDNKNTSNTALTDNVTTWAPGVHYLYYITIGANAIEFTASVNAWNTTTVSGYHYLIN